MPARFTLCLVALTGLATTGCERFMPAPATTAAPAAKPAIGGVGVVDLDVVAKRTGRDLEMNTASQERLEALNANLTKLQESLSSLLEEKRAGMGSDITEEQQQQLAAMQQRIGEQLQEAKRKAEADLVNFKQGLVEKFREEAKPILKDVAAARGLSLVIPKNNALLLSVDPLVELTEEVAQKLRAAKEGAPAETERTAKAPRKRRTAESDNG